MKKYSSLFIFFLFAKSVSADINTTVGNCEPPTASATIDINNVRAQLMNGGDMWWDIFSSNSSRYEIPKGQYRHSFFAAGLWLSAIDAGNNLHTAGQTYRQRGIDFWPGPLDSYGHIMDKTCAAWDKMFSIYGEEIQNIKKGKVSEAALAWPASYAPFKDVDGDGIYNPVLGDYPVFDINKPDNIPGQMVWWVINDKGNEHTAHAGGLPMSLEIQTTAFAYISNTSSIINNTTLYRYKFINKSTNTLYDFKLGNFVDGEVGGPDDDYIGCDVSRGLFYTYNADNFDEDLSSLGYKKTPPAVGITYLKTLKNSNGTETGTYGFIPIYKSTPYGFPRNSKELNFYLHVLNPDSIHLAYGQPDPWHGTDPTNYAFCGDTDPLGRPAWYETNPPGDKKSLSILGENVIMEPGAVQEVIEAVVWARADSNKSETNLSSLQLLRVSVDTLKEKHSNNFEEYWTGIEEKKVEAKIFPNPITNRVNIQLEKPQMEFIVQVYTINGKAIITEKFRNTSIGKIDFSNQPQGVYLIKTSIDKKEHFCKVIKN